jgi:O-antigen ligase
VFLIVYRERYTPAQKYLLAAMAAAGVMVGLFWGVVEVLQGKRALLELHSVGAVTHSAMYVGIVAVMSLAMALYAGDGLLGDDKDRRSRERRYWWAVTALSLLGLFAMASRGGIFATGMVLLLVLVLLRRKDLWIAISLMVAVCAIVVAVVPNIFDQARFAARTRAMVSELGSNRDLGVRVSNWRVAIAQVAQGHTLWFGVGPRNFSGVDLSKLHFDRPLDLPGGKLTHPHNLFLTKLVEEGLFGLAAMLAFFGLVAGALFVDWRAGRWGNPWWFSGTAALAIPVVSGFFGTPWFNEHALLAMTLFALYLSSRDPGHKAAGENRG